MISWIKRWWHEGDGDAHEVSVAEADLHAAIKERTALSQREEAVNIHETARIKSLVDTVESAIEAVKRGERNR